jgi:hypothetical protein
MVSPDKNVHPVPGTSHKNTPAKGEAEAFLALKKRVGLRKTIVTDGYRFG